MKNFIGIDLGTTNSAISLFKGADTQVWKRPIQTDVTPSAIYRKYSALMLLSPDIQQ